MLLQRKAFPSLHFNIPVIGVISLLKNEEFTLQEYEVIRDNDTYYTVDAFKNKHTTECLIIPKSFVKNFTSYL